MKHKLLIKYKRMQHRLDIPTSGLLAQSLDYKSSSLTNPGWWVGSLPDHRLGWESGMISALSGGRFLPLFHVGQLSVTGASMCTYIFMTT